MSRISVVIPTLNEERHVGSLLSDVSRQTLRPDEIVVVDGGSRDGTVAVVEGFPGVELLGGAPPVADQRNRGGRRASGDIIFFMDADVRLEDTFFERFIEGFGRKGLEVACPLYTPYSSTMPVRVIHGFFNAVFVIFQRILPSGAGHCIAVRGEVFRGSDGFDPGLKFDDIELIRRLSRGYRFGIVGERLFVSDRRYRKYGVTRVFLGHLLMALFFALGRFEWANHVDYEYGEHEW